MRPAKPVKLDVRFGKMPPEQEDDFWTAVSDFVEAIARRQVTKLRQEAARPSTDPSSTDTAAERGY